MVIISRSPIKKGTFNGHKLEETLFNITNYMTLFKVTNYKRHFSRSPIKRGTFLNVFYFILFVICGFLFFIKWDIATYTASVKTLFYTEGHIASTTTVVVFMCMRNTFFYSHTANGFVIYGAK